MAQPLDRVVAEAAQRWGDTPVVVAPAGWSLSYADLHAASGEVAVGLLESGVTEGDVVALCLPTSPDHLVALAACAKVGATTAAVNPRLTVHERTGLLGRVQPKLVLDETVLGDSSATMLASLRRRDQMPPPLPQDRDRPVAIVFTSGTTGSPKGAVFAQRQIDFITEVDTGGRWGGGGNTLGATPLAHLGPTTKFAGNLMRGGTTHLVERWRAGEALRLTAQRRMASVAGIPTQLALMLRHPHFAGADLSSVKAVVIGGGPATASLVREIRAGFNAPVATRYSCTEAGIGLGTGLTDPPEDAERSVGRPHAGVELSLRAPDTGEPVGPGEVGEVCLRSAAVMTGYWNDPVSTEAAFWPDGFLRTGDLGALDEAGRLRLAGRAKEMYVRGGYNVYPQEVEDVLAEHPAVREVAVVSQSDDVMGEVGVAFVVTRTAHDGAKVDADELRRFAGDRLAAYKLPHDVRLVDALPLTPMDKVDKVALRTRLG